MLYLAENARYDDDYDDFLAEGANKLKEDMYA